MSHEYESFMPPLSKLPTVEGNVTFAVGAEMRENPDHIEATYSRMEVEQPALVKAIRAYIEAGGRDSYEKEQMREVLVLTYRMLEAQTEADELEAQINGPGSDLT